MSFGSRAFFARLSGGTPECPTRELHYLPPGPGLDLHLLWWRYEGGLGRHRSARCFGDLLVGGGPVGCFPVGCSSGHWFLRIHSTRRWTLASG